MSTSFIGSDFIGSERGSEQPARNAAGTRLRALALTGALALALGACSTAPDWAKPSTWSDTVSGNAGETTPTNETIASKQAEVVAASEESEGFPAVGTTPEKPQARDMQTREQLASSLIADREHARYSGEALRGGTEPPASPLPSTRAEPLPDIPSAPEETVAEARDMGVIPEKEIPVYSPDGSSKAASAAPSADEEEEVASAPLPAPETPMAAPEPAPEPVQAAAAPAAPAPAASASASASAAPAASAPKPAPTRVARREPAVPATSTPTWQSETDAAVAAGVARTPEPSSQQAAAVPSSSSAPSVGTPREVAPVATGEPQFARSSAPPLPAEVRELVPAVVSARYDETSGAPAGGTSMGASSVSPGDAIVIDYSAIGGAPEPQAAYEPEQGSSDDPLGAGTGGPYQPVQLYFGHGSSSLSGDDLAQIAEVAAAQDARGGGAVRIVGHASSRTSNLPVEQHLMANFDMSLKRANAVADALMRLGVSPEDMVIEAVGDQAPVYFESMPAGEAGNRRAEIFLE